MKRVAGLEYPGGTHLAFKSFKGRDYVFAVQAPGWGGSDTGAVRSVDITNPERPKVVDTVKCGFNQGYIDISADRKTLLLGSDSSEIVGPDCHTVEGMGFLTIDISNPRRMRALRFSPVARGVHGATTHPSKPIVYISYGDVIAQDAAQFEIWSIANPRKPKMLEVIDVPGYHGPHDMTFSPNGKLMVASNVSTSQVFDTSDALKPRLLSTLQCPGCQHTHEARFTPDGKRLVVADESITPSTPCPGGGLYFYDVSKDGSLEFTGAYQPKIVGLPEGRTSHEFCTAHVIGLSRDGTKVAASWHGGGIRYVDIGDGSGLGVGDTTTGSGARELGSFVADDSDAMSAKLYKGPYLYSNDANRGFEVFKLLGGS